ncbi:pantoate kinase [Acidilobus saccharovorans]|uniref:pantoate kinase n=1 Tax=Acidilobus saccharovorans TaxID=242703 RepID=UPI0006625EB2|nr:hypothetical protein [Acidilobus saccharovorans]
MAPVCVSVPHHITAAFVPVWGSTPRDSGSVGVGIAVEPRLELCYDLKLSGEPAGTAAKLLESNGVDLSKVKSSNPLPWSFGYATSGASAVAAAHLASYLKGKSLGSLLVQAHEIEVQDRTGLGDVLAISCGLGLVLRRRAGPPGIGQVDCLYLPRSISLLSIEAGGMSTESLLSSLGDDFYVESSNVLRKLDEELSLEAFIESVRALNDKLGLPSSILGAQNFEYVTKVPGLLGYYTKKRLVILIIERDLVGDAVDYLRKGLPYDIRELSPSEAGPYLR